MYIHFFKRTFDILIVCSALIAISPILIIITIWLQVSNKGAGAFFVQARPGKEAKIFKIFKFKTMSDKLGNDGSLLTDDQRLTKVGKFLRSTSIDELPQLINVLKGDMSLIGPRPLLVQYLPLYNKQQARRHEVQPGITGWTQVNGRNSLSWQQKLELDVWYVDNQSFFLDMKILWITLLKVLKRADINSANASTMESFKGNG